jgi:CBS domain-containing protein
LQNNAHTLSFPACRRSLPRRNNRTNPLGLPLTRISGHEGLVAGAHGGRHHHSGAGGGGQGVRRRRERGSFLFHAQLSRDELVPAVLARMAAEEIIAVPVEDGGRLTSFFDLSDFLALLFASDKTDLATLPVRRASNRSGHDVFMSVEAGTGLYTLAEYFSRGVHRVPVMKDGRAEAIASQSALLEYIVKRLGEGEAALEESCELAGLTKHKATLVDASATLRQALRQLHEAASEAAGLVRSYFFSFFFSHFFCRWERRDAWWAA